MASHEVVDPEFEKVIPGLAERAREFLDTIRRRSDAEALGIVFDADSGALDDRESLFGRTRHRGVVAITIAVVALGPQLVTPSRSARTAPAPTS